MKHDAIERKRTKPYHLLIALTLLACLSCSTERRSRLIDSGTITLGADQGVVFETGEIIPGDKFNQVDLLATENGSRLRLATGGATTAKPNPVNWFDSSSGIPETFNSLDEVPNDKPTGSTGASMLKTETGIGFVLENYVSSYGGYTKGYIRQATATEVVIDYVIIE